MKIKFTTPTPDSPGFLRRTATAAKLMTSLQDTKNFKPETLDELVDFLASFVTEPSDKKKAREALLDISQNDFTDMLSALMGGGKSAVPLVTDATSDDSTLPE